MFEDLPVPNYGGKTQSINSSSGSPFSDLPVPNYGGAQNQENSQSSDDPFSDIPTPQQYAASIAPKGKISQGKSPLQTMAPTSFSSAIRGFSPAKKVGGFLGNLALNAGKDIPSIIGGIGKVAAAIPGAAINAGYTLNGDSEPTTGIGGFFSKDANQVGHGIKQAVSGEFAGVKNLIAHPGQQLGIVGNNLYEHPLGALLTAASAGDLAGGGLEALGNLGGDEGIAAAGQKIQDISNAVNPVAVGAKVVGKISSVGGNKIVAPLAGTLTGVGTKPFQDILQNPTEVAAARNGGATATSLLGEANNTLDSIQQGASSQYESSLNDLADKKNIPLDAQAMMGNYADNIAVNHGIILSQVLPQNLSTMQQFIDNAKGTSKVPLNLQDVQTLNQNAENLYKRYGLNTINPSKTVFTDPTTLGGRYPGFTDSYAPTDSIVNAFQKVIDNKGIVPGNKAGDVIANVDQSNIAKGSTEDKIVQNVTNKMAANGDNSVKGVVNTYQYLNRTLKNLPYGHPAVGVVIAAKDAIKTALGNDPDFQQLNDNYGSAKSTIAGIKSQLHLTDTTTPTQALSRLQKVYSSKDPAVQAVAQNIEKINPGFGQRLSGVLQSSWSPNKTLTPAEVLAGIMQPHFLPQIVGTAAASSPQIASRILQTLGVLGGIGSKVSKVATGPLSAVEAVLSKGQ